MQICNNRRPCVSCVFCFFFFHSSSPISFLRPLSSRCVLFLVRLPASIASVKNSFCIYYYYKAIQQVNNPHRQNDEWPTEFGSSFLKAILMRNTVPDAVLLLLLLRRFHCAVGRRLLAQLHISLEIVSAAWAYYKQQLLYLFHHFHINEISPLIFHNYAHYSYIGPSSKYARQCSVCSANLSLAFFLLPSHAVVHCSSE